jgi:uncharacterized MAPEG superfamily protein
MTVELTLLFYSTILLVVQILIPASMALLGKGIPWGVSNREISDEVSDMHGRCLRARNNMIENLLTFAIIVLIAHNAGITSDNTVLGAQLFFWGRVGHMLSYTAGIIWVRTIAWLVALVGMLLIVNDIFTYTM